MKESGNRKSGTKKDARVVRTIDTLKRTMLDLLKEHSYDEIKITELCEAAGVNRNTFYAHYNEPADILKEIEDDLLAKIWQPLAQINSDVSRTRDFVHSILATIMDNREICSIILSRRSNRHFIDQIIDALHDSIINTSISKGLSGIEAEISYHYSVAGALGVIDYWVRDGYRISVSKLTDIMCSLLENGQIHAPLFL